MAKKRVFIGVPFHSPMDILAVTSLANLISHCIRRGEYEIKYTFVARAPLPQVRNFIVHEALKVEADYLLQIDQDQVYPSDVLDKLMAHDTDIVSALYFQRKLPTLPMMYRAKRRNGEIVGYEPYTDYEKGLIEVDAVGMGMALIRTDVFRKIPEPWYWNSRVDVTEDIYFCWKAQQYGFKIYVDTNVPIGHLYSPPVITERTYRTGELEWPKPEVHSVS